MKKVVLLLGSNIGDAKEHILIAISKLEKMGRVTKSSGILKTFPIEFDSLNHF